MALLDVIDLLSVLHALTIRTVLATVAGISAGLAAYHFSDQTPAAAFVALLLGLGGLAVGIVWEIGHRRRK